MLDLFSGIGGFSLGLERAGMQTVAFCEIEPYARAVLARHWPDVPCYDDVRTLTAEQLRADGIAVDVICGGFPCQDISVAGKGAGLAGERSGLWSEYARLIGELRPRFVIVENVSALLSRGLGEVLGDLASIGFDAEWHCIPASAVGAPHRRDRIWIVAYPGDGRQRRIFQSQRELWSSVAANAGGDGETQPVANASGAERRADAAPRRRVARELCLSQGQEGAGGSSSGCEDEIQHAAYYAQDCAGVRRSQPSWWWRIEPDMGRVAHGVPSRVDRLRCLGNAVVPKIPEIIGRKILESM